MRPAVLSNTSKKNSYLYSTKANHFLIIHPIFRYLIELDNEGVDTKEWIANIKDNSLVIESLGRVSKKKLLFYYEKFQLFLENGFFEEIDIKEKISGKLSAAEVQSQLANLGHVVFEVTDACNLKCEYCTYGKFYTNYDKRQNKNLSIDTAKNVLNYLRGFWISSRNKSYKQRINIGFYGGEPLLNLKFIKEIVALTKNMFLTPDRFTYSMTTNGLLLMRAADFLVQNDFRLLVSLDGNEKNNSYRVYPGGKTAFTDILRSIEAFEKKYPEFFKKNVNFNAVLHNKNSVTDIHKFFNEKFDKTPMIAEVNPHGIVNERKEEFLRTYRNINESLRQANDCDVIEKDMYFNLPDYRAISSFIHRYSGYVFKDYKQLIHGKQGLIYVPTGTCLPFSKKLFATVNGKILPCERIGHRFDLGFANQEKVELDFQKIADSYNEYYENIRAQCNACYSTDNCQQCMFNLDIKKQNVNCSGFINKKEFSKYLSASLSYLEKKPELYSKIMKEVVFD